jgi:glucuronate isomerase
LTWSFRIVIFDKIITLKIMSYINQDFLLRDDYSKALYHEYAEKQPIIDYHCHLDPQMIAQDYKFKDIAELWLGGDHYKWRAMRADGVGEDYITGSKPSWEKFLKWAETMPALMGNPLYVWTHLELARVFGIYKILKPETAKEIYDECNEKLRSPEYSAQNLIRRFNVEVVCTTDDPADSLEWHKQIAEHPFGVKVLPAWRPDRALGIDNPDAFNEYLKKLGESADTDIHSYSTLLDALKKRHDFFASMGCRLSDHGLAEFYADDCTSENADTILKKVLVGIYPNEAEVRRFRSALLYDLAVMDAESGWVQQFHVGVIRNNNSRMFLSLGPDAGFDSIYDHEISESGNRFLDRLASSDKLAKTILYCLNPKDSEVLSTMAYNFNDGSCPGKMQLGAAWWFLDNESGMRAQLDVLSNTGLLSRFVGMLTDSRSFISYPRHEYFRRILCSFLGDQVRTGRLPESEMDTIGKMVSDICYGNAKEYFKF